MCKITDKILDRLFPCRKPDKNWSQQLVDFLCSDHTLDHSTFPFSKPPNAVSKVNINNDVYIYVEAKDCNCHITDVQIFEGEADARAHKHDRKDMNPDRKHTVRKRKIL